VIASIQVVVLLALYLIVFAMCVVALVDAARRPASAFATAGKRTKNFWLTVLGIATAVAFVALPYPIGIGDMSLFVAGIAAAAAGVYLADVRPAVDPYSGRGGRGGGGGRGPRRPGSGGGW